MTEELNQQSAIAKLAKVNPEYAQALSGQNPPPQPPYEKPDFTLSLILRYGIPWTLPFVWLFFAMQAKPNEFPVYSPLLIMVGLVIWVSVAIGRKIKRTQEQRHPIPPSPILYTLHPTLVEFLKQYLGNEIILTLRYDIPVESQQTSTGPLHKILTLETEDLIDQFIEQYESIYLAADDEKQKRLRADGHLKLNTDLLEYQLVPKFGRAVYESKIPVFRFKITAKAPRAILEHDIEVGDIIDGAI